MELHHQLRSLGDTMGVAVFGDADTLRGALDDYLDESAASAGEINLLVDAVRQEALRSLIDMVGAGAAPEPAVQEAGRRMAERRGSDDVVASMWAVAVLGYAVGRLSEDDVRPHVTRRGLEAPTGAVPPPPPPAPTTPLPVAPERPAPEQQPFVPAAPTMGPGAPAAALTMGPGVPAAAVTMGPPPTAPLAPTSSAAPSGGRRRLPLLIGVVALVLALVGGGFVAWKVFFGNDGGADSPEAAVTAFLDALEAQDPVAAFDATLPGEVSGLGDAYGAVRTRLEEEGLISGPGISDTIDLTIDGTSYAVDELGEDYARVGLGGVAYSASFDPETLPERLDPLRDQVSAGSGDGDLGEELSNGEDPFALMTVKYDGRWYVSLVATALDQSMPDLRDQGYAEPDFADVPELDPVVGEEPADVLANLVEAANRGNAAALLGNLPAEAVVGALPYLPTFQSILDREGVQVDVALTDLSLSQEELDDDRLLVTIDRATLTGTASANGSEVPVDVSVAGPCVSVDGDEECSEDGTLAADLGVTSLELVMVEVDGGYQLDPVATIAAYLAGAAESLPYDRIDDLILDLADDSQI